jgi:hypothetical protein
MKLDASCSSGPVTTYDWIISAPPALGGVTTHTGDTVERNFVVCSGETVTVTLTVGAGASSTDTTTQSITLPANQRAGFRGSFTSSLLVESHHRTTLGNIVINGARIDGVSSARPFLHEFETHAGLNTVEAVLLSKVRGEMIWRFDFSRAERFIAGSLEVEQGQMISRDTHSIAFRLSGASGERIKFTYRLVR